MNSHTRTHKFKRLFCTQKPGLNDCLKDFWYTKINPTQIWYEDIAYMPLII